MFTGIIEKMGRVERLEWDKKNLHITMASDLAPELKIDQSLSHNGVCLTVVNKTDRTYTVTAIQETLDRSNLGNLEIGDFVNLERSMQMQGRIDGHIVQGHVDQTATCVSIDEAEGSWIFGFEYEGKPEDITVEKGSISVNGVSLTVVDSKPGYFSVAIIPYTYENTNFGKFKIGTKVNLEFDVIGKYVAAYMKQLKD